MSTTNETGFDDVASAGSLHPTPEGDHLRYLLTAYLFENLSDAGRREVENHLRECDACRAELDELLRTRTLLESVLGEPPGYSFDERRRERILAAAGERRPGWLGALRRRLPMAVAAAMVLCVLGGFLLMMTTSSRMGYESASRDRSLARAPQKSTGFEASQSAPGLEVFDDRAASVEEKLSFDMNGRPAPDTTAGAVTPGLSTPSRVEYHAVTAPEAPTDGDVSAPTVEFGQQWRGPEKPNAMQFYNAALENEKQDGARSADGRFRVDGVVGGGEEGRTRVWLEDQLVTEATGVGGGAAGAHGDRYSRDGEAAAKELGASPGGTDPRWRSYGAMKSPETSTAGVAPPASGPAPEAERVADTQWHARTRTENLRQNADDDFAQRIDQGVDSFADLATPQPQEPAVQRPTGTFEKNLARAGEYRERGKASAADEQIRRELELETAELAKKTDTLWERGVAEGQQAQQQQEQQRQAQRPETPPAPVTRDMLDSKVKQRIVGKEEHSRGQRADDEESAEIAEPVLGEDALTYSWEVTPGRGGRSGPGGGAGGAGGTVVFDSIPGADGAEVVDLDAVTRSLPLLGPSAGDTGVMSEENVQLFTILGVDGGRKGGWGYGVRSAGGQAGAVGVGALEHVLRGYLGYRALDPTLDLERYVANPLPLPAPEVGDEGLGEAAFRERHGTNPFVDASRDRLSTFSLDVDTASYTLARNMIDSGRLPPAEAVRVEEFVNYFTQDYRADPEEAFSVFCDGMPSPFGSGGVELLRVGIKARELSQGERRDAVLTLAVDVSGSMGDSSRLELVKQSLGMLIGQLAPTDRVAVVAYAGEAHVVLPHTLARNRERILGALGSLVPRGGTNMEAGLDLAYRLASEVLSPGAVHRVLLISDGVANIGARRPEEILEKVDVYKRRGIYLTVIGIGDRVRDDMLEKISNAGNGRYDFIRSASHRAAMADASRIFRDNLPGALEVLAEDAKIQVEFNPDAVTHYRLLGYENRDIADRDFRNDKIDAAEVGPGTTVTVLYEVVRRPASVGSLATVRLRYRDTSTRQVVERDYPVPQGILVAELGDAPFSLRHLAAVAEVAELLRDSYYARDGSFADVLAYLGAFDENERARSYWREITSLAGGAFSLTLQKLQREVNAIQAADRAAKQSGKQAGSR